MDIIYRELQEEDRKQAEDLIQELHSYHYKNGNERFNEHINGIGEVIDYMYKNDIVYVAEQDNKLIGLIDFSDDLNKEGSFMKAEHIITIHNLIITSSMRHTGIGTHLMNICKQYAKESADADISFRTALLNKSTENEAENHGVDIELGVYAFNQQAIDFYTKQGFEVCFIHMKHTG